MIVLGLMMVPNLAQAHPHILVDAQVSVVFDEQGRIVELRNVWDFDDAFSAFAVQGYDSKGDGLPTREDLAPLAEVNVTSLAEYYYFTTVTVNGSSVSVSMPRDYYNLFENERLQLHFTLPLTHALDMRAGSAEIDIYDPEYFAAVTLKQESPVQLVHAPKGCSVNLIRPGPLDPNVAQALSVIPASQRTLPSDLEAVTQTLKNIIRVNCK